MARGRGIVVIAGTQTPLPASTNVERQPLPALDRWAMHAVIVTEM
jgi:hypothetical protein